MANSFSQIYLHLIFVTVGRSAYFRGYQKEKIFSYLRGIANEHESHISAIDGGENHIHILNFNES
jgi:putative transposase